MKDSYFETINEEIAAKLIGSDNLKEGAVYRLVNDPFEASVLRIEANGTETTFELEITKDEDYSAFHTDYVSPDKIKSVSSIEDDTVFPFTKRFLSILLLLLPILAVIISWAYAVVYLSQFT